MAQVVDMRKIFLVKFTTLIKSDNGKKKLRKTITLWVGYRMNFADVKNHLMTHWVLKNNGTVVPLEFYYQGRKIQFEETVLDAGLVPNCRVTVKGFVHCTSSA